LRNIYQYVLIELGILIMAFILKLGVQVISSLQLLVYTLILTRSKSSEEDSWETQDLRLIERLSEYPGNLENTVFKSLSDADWNTSYRWIFEKAVRDNINGFGMENAIVRHSGSSGTTVKILMKLVSSLFAKDAVSARKVLGNYIIILKENEILKNERRNIFSEARFRARIMLIISALLMGFLSAAGPIINMFYSFPSNPVYQPELQQTFSLFIYLISVSILVHYSLSYRGLLRTLFFSTIGFIVSFLIFNNILSAFLLKMHS